ITWFGEQQDQVDRMNHRTKRGKTIAENVLAWSINDDAKRFYKKLSTMPGIARKKDIPDEQVLELDEVEAPAPSMISSQVPLDQYRYPKMRAITSASGGSASSGCEQEKLRLEKSKGNSTTPTNYSKPQTLISTSTSSSSPVISSITNASNTVRYF
ncbi:unnamed protein product, partial [Amoebophrya sp. A25]